MATAFGHGSIPGNLPGDGLRTWLVHRAPVVAAVAVGLLGLAGRLVSDWGAPLWFDETFTAVIASQMGVSDLIGWCRNEVGAPLYYVLVWGWAQLFGTDQTVLRLPSLFFSIAAPLLALFRGHRDRRVRMIWAAALTLYVPGFDFASAARCYALLVLLGTAASIVYLRLLERPNAPRALAWTSLSVLGVLTHYHYALLAGVQGMLFVLLMPRSAVRTLPALAPLIPLGLWMSVHYPMLQRFSAHGAWYPELHWLDALLGFTYVFGSLTLGVLIPVTLLWWLIRRLRGDDILGPVPAIDAMPGLSGLLALVIVVGIDLWTPSLTWRYTAAYVPAITLGGAIWLVAAGRQRPLLPAVALSVLAANAVGFVGRAAVFQEPGYRYTFNLDYPSAWLAAGRPEQVAFLWDSPAGSMADPARIGEVAGYFLRRHGAADVRMLVLNAARRPHPWTQVAAATRQSDALIWIAGADEPKTRAATNPELLRRLGWTCREFGRRGDISVLACQAG